MTAKKIYFDDDVLKRLQKGIDDIADPVKVTLGPSGRNVALDKPFGSPTVTKDGVSVARDITFDDVRKLGADIAKQSSIRTAEEAGDGTTSSMVLTQAIFGKSRKAVAAGFHPIFMQRGMQTGLKEALAFLEDYAAPVDSKEDIAKIATLAANGDAKLGNMIADAMEMVGKDGVISVKESQKMTTELTFSEGLQFDLGYETPDYLVDPEATSVQLEAPLIALFDKVVSSAKDLIPVLQVAVDTKRPLAIISHGLEGEARTLVVTNVIRRSVSACSAKAPRIGEKRSMVLENLAIHTGANVISDATGVNLENYEANDLLGSAAGVTFTSSTTTFIEGMGSDDEIEQRIKEMRGRVSQSASEYDREFFQQQASQLSGGLAVINVGASSELEMKEYKARVEDALSATQSAVKNGIVPGGGSTLLKISLHLEEIMASDAFSSLCTSEEERYGFRVFAESLKEPFLRIMYNAGREPAECLYRFKEALENQHAVVLDARSGDIGDAQELGILDPAKVVEQVMTNAVSVAGITITTACMITNVDTEDCFEDDE